MIQRKRILLSLIIITKNSQATLLKTLASVQKIVDEIILVDNQSTDATLAIARRFQAKIFHFSGSYAKRKKFALTKSSGEWILNLDDDEIVSPALAKEIKKAINHQVFAAYYLPYQNYCFNRPLNYGGERYQKLRLFKKAAVLMPEELIHEKFILKVGYQAGQLKHKIQHYSYRSLKQMLFKFTLYARLMAINKFYQGERTNWTKIILYPIHMFWARYIKDQGYRDGWVRIPLDLGFAYMEFMTYFLMLFKPKL
jgi:glycosyltransferase involved in cell wall biosynthesis